MTARPRSRRRRAAVLAVPLALAALLLALVPPSQARAHAALLETDPEDGAVLEAAPSAVTLSFNEPVDPVAAAMRLVDQDGREHPVEATATDLDVVVTVPDLDEGRYVLSWRVISTDAHPIAGAVAFAVGTDTPAPDHVDRPAADEDDRTAIMAVSAFHYLGLLVFTGFLFFKVAIARGLWPGRPRHRLLRLSGALAVIAAVVAVPADALAVAGLPLSRIADIGTWSATAQAETVAILVLTAAGIGSAYWWYTRGRGAWAAPLALAAAAIAAAAPVLIGHSMLFGPRWLMVSADVAHLFAGAVWTGGLIGLIVLLRHARRAGADATGPATVVARFSTWAGATVGLLGASGLAMAVMIHREWDGFFGSGHGRLLLVKLALVALAVGLAAWNRFRLVPAVRTGRGGLRRLGRILLAEAAAVLSVIAVTATLVHLNPDGEASERADTTVAQRLDLGTGELEAVLSPGATGSNTLTIDITDAAGRPLEPLEPPRVLASLQDFGPITTEAAPDPDGGYRAALDLPLPGRWEIEIHVRVSEFEHHIATVTADIA